MKVNKKYCGKCNFLSREDGGLSVCMKFNQLIKNELNMKRCLKCIKEEKKGGGE